MKNFKKFTAFVLTLCMLFSLSVAVFAAEADEHTIYDSAPTKKPRFPPKLPPPARFRTAASAGSLITKAG